MGGGGVGVEWGVEEGWACRAANQKEKKKMEIFLKSPKLYLAVIMVNERFLIPVKQRLRRH